MYWSPVSAYVTASGRSDFYCLYFHPAIIFFLCRTVSPCQVPDAFKVLPSLPLRCSTLTQHACERQRDGEVGGASGRRWGLMGQVCSALLCWVRGEEEGGKARRDGSGGNGRRDASGEAMWGNGQKPRGECGEAESEKILFFFRTRRRCVWGSDGAASVPRSVLTAPGRAG